MINNDTIRVKRRKRNANTIDLNDPVAMRLRIIRLEEEAERSRIIMNVFASLLPGFSKLASLFFNPANIIIPHTEPHVS